MNWNKHFSQEERQRKSGLETMACTNFAHNNALEAKANSKKFTTETREWAKDKGFINFKGNWDFSDRALARMSGTSKDGNYQHLVNATAEDRGLVPELMWPFVSTWKEYYKEIPPGILELALDFLARFDVIHEAIPRKNWDKRIKESPIIAFVWAWQKKNGVYICPKNKSGTNHAIVVYRKSRQVNGYKVWDIEDSYNPFNKPVDSNNFSGWGYLVDLIDKNNLNIMDFVKKHDQKLIRNKKTGAYGAIYKKMLYTISQDRAGLFMVDREARGIIGEKGIVSVSDKIWESLPKKEF